jgi:hypothetical protein
MIEILVLKLPIDIGSTKYNTNSYEQTMGEPYILIKEVIAWL